MQIGILLRQILRRFTASFLIVLALGGSAGLPCVARAENRVYLADQSNWGANQGFYIDLENHGSVTPHPLSNLTLYLGIGSGSSWRFVSSNIQWQLNTTYDARATISSTSANLLINGKSMGVAPGGFKPPAPLLLADELPSWASETASYVVVEDTLNITVNGKAVLQNTFPTRGPGVLAYLANPLVHFNVTIPAGATVVVDTKFHFVTPPDSTRLNPLIDAYFQNASATGSWKVTKDSDLIAAQAKETTQLAKWGTPSGYDAYGGWLHAGWTQKGTGFFTTAEHDGKWWLISPLGNPLIYFGLDTVSMGVTGNVTPVTGRKGQFAWLPPTSGTFNSAWLTNYWGDGPIQYVDTTTCNLIRKYGTNWSSKAQADALNRIRTIGFTGTGKWSAIYPNTPWIAILGHWAVPNVVGGGHMDIWDPATITALKGTLSQQLASVKNDPHMVCVSMDNEIAGIVLQWEIPAILKLGASVPAKKALCDYGIKTLYQGNIAKLAAAWKITATTAAQVYASNPTPSDADIESLRDYYEDAYYALVRKTIKAYDPNHLYVGYWIVPGWWQNATDWTLNAKYCDVIGYDRYSNDYTDSFFAPLVEAAKKPILCGEFSFPPIYQGGRGFGQYPTWANDDADAGVMYQTWVKSALADPYCVGMCWFEYHDEALSGRGPGNGTGLVYGEDYAFGITDGTDRLKWDLVTAMRAAHLAAPTER